MTDDQVEELRRTMATVRAVFDSADLAAKADLALALWNDKAQVGVFALHTRDIRDLAATYAPFGERIRAIRDAYGHAADSDPSDHAARADWAHLNAVLDEEHRTLSWYEAVRNQPAHEGALVAVRRCLLGLLTAEGRWAEVGHLFTRPLEELATMDASRRPEAVPGWSPETYAMMQPALAARFRARAALLYGCLLAAGRDVPARELAEEALRLEPTGDMQLALARAARGDCSAFVRPRNRPQS